MRIAEILLIVVVWELGRLLAYVSEPTARGIMVDVFVSVPFPYVWSVKPGVAIGMFSGFRQSFLVD